MNFDERQNLTRISQNSLYSAGVMRSANAYCFTVLSRHFRGKSILELGPAEGVMTESIATTGLDATVVEASPLFCESLRARFPDIHVVESLFEDYEPDQKFDNVVLGHVLEHVADPVDILKRVRRWLSPDARVLSAVPNARSIHRQAAVIMGLLKSEDELNDLDRHHGHRRVFTPESFRNCFYEAGFRVDLFGGYFLKPISNSQIESSWSPQMVDAFLQMGERYPDIAGEIYVVASVSH